MPPNFTAGSASVNIVPDFSGAQRKIQQWMAGMGDIRVGVDPHLDQNGIRRMHTEINARRPSMKVDLDFRHFERQAAKLTDFFVGFSMIDNIFLKAFGPRSVLMTSGVGALTAIGAAAVQSLNVLYLIPAAVTAAAAPLAALVIGLQGMSDAFKAVTKANQSSSADAAAAASARKQAAQQVQSAQQGVETALRRVEGAERSLGDAQRATRQAQEDLNRARAEAVRDLQDMNMELARASLDEESAVLSVARAQERLTKVNQAGSQASLLDRQEADLSYRQAQKSLEEIRVRNARLRDDVAAANAAGVEGSDRVTAARDRVAGAIQSEKDAQQSLGDAQRSVIDAQRQLADATAAAAEAMNSQSAAQQAVAEAMANLAPSARDFVTQVLALKGAWTDLRLDVQQQLFNGLGDSITNLAKSSLPALRAGLAGIAGELNSGFRQTMDFFARPDVVNDFATTLTNVKDSFHELNAAAAPLSRIWVDLATVGSSFFPGFAKAFAEAAQSASDWVSRMRETGRLNEMIQTGIDVLKTLGSIVANVGQILYGVFRAGAETGGTLLQILEGLTDALGDFLNSPVAQSALGEFFGNIGKAVQALLPGLMAVVQSLVTGVLPAMSGLVAAVAPVVGGLLQDLAKMIGEIAPLFYPALAEAIAAMLSALAPLIPVISHVAQIILPILADLIARLAPFVGTLAEAFGELVTMLADALAPILPMVADALVSIVEAIMPLVPPLLDIVRALLPPLIALLSAVIPIIVQVVEALAPAIAALAEGMAPALQVVAEIVAWAFKEIIGPLITFIIKVVVVPLINLLASEFESLGGVIRWVFENLIKPTWEAIQTAAVWLWEEVLQPIWGFMQDAWDALALGLKLAWELIVKPVWDALAAAANWLWDHVLRPVWDSMQAGWDALMNGLKALYDRVLHPVWDIFKRAVDSVKGAFEAAIEGIRIAWDKMMDIAATPINFVIEMVFNRGLFTAWNWVVDNIGLPRGWRAPHWDQLDRGMHFATGGPIPGHSPTATADNIPIMATAGEFMHPVDSVDFYGLDAMEAVRRRKAAIYYADGGLIAPPGFADGGPIWKQLDALRRQLYPGSVLTSAVRPGDPGYHGRGMAIDIGWPGNLKSQLDRIGADLAVRYGGSAEIIHNPTASVKNGRRVPSSLWGPAVWGQHADHVHWAVSALAQLFAGAGGAGSAEIDKPWYADVWDSLTGAFSWFKDKIGAVGEMVGRFGDNPMVQMISKVPETIMNRLWDSIKSKVGGLFESSFTPTASGEVAQAVQQVFATKGWGSGAQWNAVDWLIQHESSWNPRAQNPSSTASGLFQHIDSTWRAYRNRGAFRYPHMKDAPVGEQAAAGLNYIMRRYNDPLGAKAFWGSHHWYDNGGWLPPGMSTIYNGTGRPEPVLTAAEHDALVAWQTRNGRGGDDDGDFASWISGGLHFHGVEERTRNAVMDDLWHRLRVARRGGVHSGASPYSVG